MIEGLGHKVKVSLKDLKGQLASFVGLADVLEEEQMNYYRELIKTANEMERGCSGYNMGLRTAEELIHTVVPKLAQAVADLASDRVHDADVIADFSAHNATLERSLGDAEGYIEYLTNKADGSPEALPTPAKSYDEMIEWIESSTIESLMQAFGLVTK